MRRSFAIGLAAICWSHFASAEPMSLAPPEPLPETPPMVGAAAQPPSSYGGGFIEFLVRDSRRQPRLGSTLCRIHGSNEPWQIGKNVSSGCIRMRNADVIDLYDRVKVGTKVVVL